MTVTANTTTQFTNPVDGGTIGFAVDPAANGASAALSADTGTITGGQASVTATADTVAGSYSVTASSAGASSASFSLTNLPPITISPAALPPATAGVTYRLTLSASGPVGGPYTFYITAGALPAGLRLSPQCLLSGTSTVAQTGSFTVTVNGAGGSSGSLVYSPVINPAAAPKLVIASQPTTATPDAAFSPSPVVYEEDRFGNIETADSSTVVTAELSSGSGPLQGTTQVTVSDGVATFSNPADNKAETITLKFTAGALTKATSNSITVRPAAASRFVVAGFPSPATAGEAGTFTVTAEDAYSNTTPAYASTVAFTSSDAQAVLPSSASLVDGVGSFGATLRTAGAQSLTATDTSHPAITGSQAGITVKPAAASKLSVGAPSSATAGTAFTVTVTALDPYGTRPPATGARSTSPARTRRPSCPPITPSHPRTAACIPSPPA